MAVGSASDVLAWGSSLDYTFNTLGHVLTQDSPATDATYTENPNYQGWIFDVIYEMKVSGDLFATHGFGEVEALVAREDLAAVIYDVGGV